MVIVAAVAAALAYGSGIFTVNNKKKEYRDQAARSAIIVDSLLTALDSLQLSYVGDTVRINVHGATLDSLRAELSAAKLDVKKWKKQYNENRDFSTLHVRVVDSLWSDLLQRASGRN